MRSYAALCVCMADDFSLRENVQALLARNVEPIYLIAPTRYWATGEPHEADELEELEAIRRDCGARLVRCNLPDQNPLLAEAHARNIGLQIAEAEGHEHVLTFDADELWLPGALEDIDAALNKADTALAGRFLPVVGIPGYPMEGYRSLDRIYTPRGVRYKLGRVCPGAVEVGTARLIHFAGTRRTEPALYRRYLRSTNYSQGPNVAGLAQRMAAQKPGAPSPIQGQPWFPLREWTAEEWALLPATLKAYLASPFNGSTVQPFNRSTSPEERPCAA